MEFRIVKEPKQESNTTCMDCHITKDFCASCRTKIANLEQRGWTLANIGRALGLKSVTIESWKAGIRSPSSLQLVLDKLSELEKKNRVPPKKIYQKAVSYQEASYGQ